MSDLGEKSNTNGLGADPLQRLASLKPPRDLSLGGMKPNRKIFTPNLNVTRNKNKGPSTANSRDQNRDDRNRKDRKNDKNRNFKNGPKIIKSTGVFSEGLGSAERHTSSRVSYGRESEGTPTLQRPTIRVKDVIKIDKELEEQKIKAAFGDSTSYEDASEDFKTILDIEAPVKLPMDNGGFSNVKSGVKVKQEVVVKQEPSDDADLTNVQAKTPLVDVKEVFEENNVADLLRGDQPALILLQLADTLPGRGGAGDDTRPSTSAEEGGEDKPQVDNRCRLADLEEGKIGKLRVHRSGRVTLALGDTIFEVCSGTKASFHQEVVSVAADDASRSACMVSLGALTHKLNVTPHWRDMFHNMSL
ncbi:DNA-directed RNA polymerase III subunit RPC4 isoform X1 [Maniola hyperantus]|uniref:DNA-directed RNA polymerase III subunit RPC4 isoform X1 n=1 Tax=Aphantopus hyperantus TaxID=2795564 RepID=UPI0015699FAA|nr:DNA-directed RNA polymerase III subunit RPC4 isoform X1 [Maniola hyperantus]